MDASTLRSVGLFGLVALFSAGCSTASAPVAAETLSGWQPAADGTYVCQPPACALMQRAGHDAISLGPAGQNVFERNDDGTRRAFERALRDGSVRDAAGGNADLSIDGAVTRTMVGATEGLTFAIAGAQPDGGQADPGHAIIVPKDGRYHMVYAFGGSKAAARAAARHFVNAVSL
ncbi:MAG: hypothetical protein JJ920_17360 [Roseitalea sp.]|jgi:hypothetical protein|nr:hypothetical protein [Roseitalea sp.]MBO6723701.1 hypothetical protein [Roseitalea sp.]MBO6744684.1 hypothetical protein [Roseitalea sp.]